MTKTETPNITVTAGSGAANHRLAQLFTPSSTFSGEKLRGAMTSIVSGSAAGGMNFGLVAAGLDPTTAAFLGLYLFGSFLGYAMDILFAKRSFVLRGGGAGEAQEVAYTAMATRARWLIKSLVGKQFFRFLISVLIDTLVGLAILVAAVEYMDEREILVDFKYRDTFVAGFIAIFTFFLFTNVLRFDWAYRDADDPMLNVVVIMWSTLVLMIFATVWRGGGRGAKAAKKEEGENTEKEAIGPQI